MRKNIRPHMNYKQSHSGLNSGSQIHFWRRYRYATSVSFSLQAPSKGILTVNKWIAFIRAYILGYSISYVSAFYLDNITAFFAGFIRAFVTLYIASA